MTYDLFLGDRTYSSWSLRGWLMLEKFDLPYRTHMIGLYSDSFREQLAALAPARTVPVLRTPEGHVIPDTLAMAETLAERHPEAGLWPAEPAQRALARALVAEMHSGFTALRGACPMNLEFVYDGFAVSDAVAADLDRIARLWALARSRATDDGPWLFGRYRLADVFYAPGATRITTSALPVPPDAAAYVAAPLSDPAFQAWRRDGLKVVLDPKPYAMDLPTRPWPGD